MLYKKNKICTNSKHTRRKADSARKPRSGRPTLGVIGGSTQGW